MKTFLCGLAVLPFLTTAALAQPTDGGAATQPMQLTAKQMDSVTAGWSLLETDLSNTSWTQVSVWEPGGNMIGDPTGCNQCYLSIQNQALSVGSVFGRTPYIAPTPPASVTSGG